jgi:hypothetical protein
VASDVDVDVGVDVGVGVSIFLVAVAVAVYIPVVSQVNSSTFFCPFSSLLIVVDHRWIH